MTQAAALAEIEALDLVDRLGRVRSVSPTHIEADGPNVSIGALCAIETRSGLARGETIAEVVGVRQESVILAPFADRLSAFVGARVRAVSSGATAPVGDGVVGRALDALGRPIDGKGDLKTRQYAPLRREASSPLERAAISSRLDTGVRAIDGLLTLGRGQRVGLFAASGAGKTTLIHQLAGQVDADRIVICLVGERGREVEALWEEGLSPERRKRAVLVAAGSHETAALRARAPWLAMALAEHWRDQGLHVLLLVDSMTRMAMAMRELGLAAGEPPTIRAYPPSVFSTIPQWVERAGAWRSGGAITAIVSVLSETDDVDDPVSELMKSLLDGHIVLSRSLAEQGQFPAIDAPRSISRLASALMAPEHRAAAQKAIGALGAYEAARLLIETGAYAAGSDTLIDDSIRLRNALGDYMRQPTSERVASEDARRDLMTVVGVKP